MFEQARPCAPRAPHDRSRVFDPNRPAPLTRGFENQPDAGRMLGFDFSREPLNAKYPMQPFEEIMRIDIEQRPQVMQTQRATT